MDVTPLPFRGAYLFHGWSSQDTRGDFTRIVDLDAFRGIVDDSALSYIAAAHNLTSGTIRGLHYQAPPHEEAKTVWCETGSAMDVIVDLRADEPTYGTWASVELSADDPAALHIPRGMAHGYQTTADHTTLMYMISAPHDPASARAIKWSDPKLGIDWPLPVTAISDHDANAPTFGAAIQ